MNIVKRIMLAVGFGADVSKNLLNVREELEEHLRSINENTDEIQTNHAFLSELNEKIEKLAARIERIEYNVATPPATQVTVQPLSAPEKEIFLALYTDEGPVTYTTLSERVHMPLHRVKDHVSTLIEKGIPLVKTYVDGHPFLRLDRTFKEKQAKENVVNCSLTAYV